MSTAPEITAVVARITAGDGSQPGVPCSDADPTAAAYPYAVVYADGGPRVSDRECDSLNVTQVGFQTTVIGVSAGQCRAALDRVTASLEGWAPTVAGRHCTRIEHPSSQPVRKDEDLADRSVFIATDQWRFTSEPA